MAAGLTKQALFTIENERQMGDSFKILDLMRRKGKLCDVILVVGNLEILAHKNVLASCSPYFYSMFINAADARRQQIEFNGDPQLFLSVVNYIYTSKLAVQEGDIKEVLQIAKMLLLHSIQSECLKKLGRVVDATNCLNIKSMASMCGDSELLNNTLRYIDANFVDVVASEEFTSLTNNELVELISRDTLKIPSEEKVYECVVRWINHDVKSRRKYLRSLMGYVRIPFISKVYLKEHIVNDSLLKGDTHCKDLIINALLDDDRTTTLTTKSRQYSDSNILLVVGGSGIEAEQSLEYYSFKKRKWSKAVKIPLSVELTGGISVDGNVYIIGGLRNNTFVNSVYLYDMVTNNWFEIEGMITERARLGVTVLYNSIYAVGGECCSSTLNSAERFDFNTQKWISIAPMCIKRGSLGVCVLDDMLYAVGGYDGTNQLRSVERYDYRTDSWKMLCCMNSRRSGGGVCALDGKIYAIGGYNGEQMLETVEVYDPKTDNWRQISPLNIPRGWASVAVINNEIYVVGGQDTLFTTNIKSVEVYDKKTNSWSVMPEFMKVERTRHAMVVLDAPN